jgi:hypothetical protein
VSRRRGSVHDQDSAPHRACTLREASQPEAAATACVHAESADWLALARKVRMLFTAGCALASLLLGAVA